MVAVPTNKRVTYPHNRFVEHRRATGGKLAVCHRLNGVRDFLNREPRVAELYSTNFVSHGYYDNRIPIRLHALNMAINSHGLARFPNIRIPVLHPDKNGKSSIKSTLMCFPNGKTVSNGIADFALIYLMFIQGSLWIARNLRFYSAHDYGDMFFSAFVTVNNPYTGRYAYPVDTNRLHLTNGTVIRNSEKFRGFATRIRRTSTSVFENSKFIVVGGRTTEEVISCVETALTIYDDYFIKPP